MMVLVLMLVAFSACKRKDAPVADPGEKPATTFVPNPKKSEHQEVRTQYTCQGAVDLLELKKKIVEHPLLGRYY